MTLIVLSDFSTTGPDVVLLARQANRLLHAFGEDLGGFQVGVF